MKSVLKKKLLFLGTLGGVLLGAASGVFIKTLDPIENMEAFIAYPGELFFRALKLMILPSVVFSLILGSASLDIKSNGRIAVRTFSYFLATSLFNTILGVGLVILIHPGNPANKATGGSQNLTQFQSSLVDNLFDLGRNIVPPNIFTTVFESTQTVYKTAHLSDSNERRVKVIEERKATNFLGVITISLVVGSVLSTMEKQVKPLLDVVSDCDRVVTKIVRGIMWATPLGVTSLICSKVIEVQNVSDIMNQLGLLILRSNNWDISVPTGFHATFLLHIHAGEPIQILHWCASSGHRIRRAILVRWRCFEKTICRRNWKTFLFGVIFRAGALPVTLQCLDENIKLDSRISRFVVPLGVTINMDGTAMFVTIASIFIAQMNGVELDFQNYVTVCLLATAVSIATATTPSASLSIIFIILQALGLPVSDIGHLFSVDWILDRLRITNNVLGDCYAAPIVQRLSL